jgi:hypothetical protein
MSRRKKKVGKLRLVKDRKRNELDSCEDISMIEIDKAIKNGRAWLDKERQASLQARLQKCRKDGFEKEGPMKIKQSKKKRPGRPMRKKTLNLDTLSTDLRLRGREAEIPGKKATEEPKTPRKRKPENTNEALI